MLFRVSLIISIGLFLLNIISVAFANHQRLISKTTVSLTDILLKATSKERFNYVASPFASSVILALATEGADTETKNQLIAALGGEVPDKNFYKEVLTSIKGYSSDGNAHNRAVLKNYLYVYKNYSVLESFAELARDYYLTDVKTVARPDLEVAALRGKDRAEDENTTTTFNEHAMLMFNGFSLEMNWPHSTWHRTSVSWNGNVVRAFGAAGNFAIGQLSSLDCTVFQLPYKNTNYALLVFMPKNKDGMLDKILEKLPEIGLEEVTNNMSMKSAFVTMPCFQSSNITSLKMVLQENSQVKNIFTNYADLSKLSSEKLYLDDIVQQAGINMCIEGTNSYSLTSSAFTSQRVIKDSVVVDRPFVYALYNTVNNIIYVAGKLEQPNWEEETEANIDLDTDLDRLA